MVLIRGLGVLVIAMCAFAGAVSLWKGATLKWKTRRDGDAAYLTTQFRLNAESAFHEAADSSIAERLRLLESLSGSETPGAQMLRAEWKPRTDPEDNPHLLEPVGPPHRIHVSLDEAFGRMRMGLVEGIWDWRLNRDNYVVTERGDTVQRGRRAFVVRDVVALTGAGWKVVDRQLAVYGASASGPE